MMNIPATKIDYELGNLRRSAVVMTFGPGSIVDFRSENSPISAVVTGLEEWDRYFYPAGLQNDQTVFEPRLQRQLGVNGFRLPPVVDENYKDRDGKPDKRSLVAVRFPTWLQCPQCSRIAPYYYWSNDPGKASRYCPACTAKNHGKQHVNAIPVRFVMVCEAGHLDEFPWHWWVNHDSKCKNTSSFLLLQSKAPGLSGMILSCPECGASRSMDGIFNVQNWKGFNCRGKRPWLRTENVKCGKKIRVLQRGASNIYFPVIVSALSIPPWSDTLQDALGCYWSDIVNTPPADRAGFIELLARVSLKGILNELNMTPNELANAIETRLKSYNGNSILDIRQEEYRQFISPLPPRQEEKTKFEIRNVDVPEDLRFYFSNIVRVVRLQEVRAIKGFTRIKPPSDENDKNIVSLSAERTEWLPAIVVRGEGIFLSFNLGNLHKWENNDEVKKRARRVRDLWQREWVEIYGEGEPSPVITSRFLLIHTWAHALMRQLTLECGYSSASLRERLYIAEGENQMAGVLIYTATSDSDGTLGGLQRQGKPENISKTVRAAIKAIEWCSSDPLCIKEMVAAPENYSLAACHACCLAPETSCEQYNRFLDRVMLIGHPEDQNIGYFSPVLRRA